jgi:multiple sugar transport system permease protein
VTFVLNSVLVTGTTVILSLLICSLAAFSFTFLNWKGRGRACSRSSWPR